MCPCRLLAPYLALWAIVAPVASPGGLSHGAFVLLLAFLWQPGAAHAGACARVRHPSWPDITSGRQVEGSPRPSCCWRLSGNPVPLTPGLAPGSGIDHFWPSRGASWVPFFTHLCPCSMATCASMAGWGLPSCSSMRRASSYVVLLHGLLLPYSDPVLAASPWFTSTSLSFLIHQSLACGAWHDISSHCAPLLLGFAQ